MALEPAGDGQRHDKPFAASVVVAPEKVEIGRVVLAVPDEIGPVERRIRLKALLPFNDEADARRDEVLERRRAVAARFRLAAADVELEVVDADAPVRLARMVDGPAVRPRHINFEHLARKDGLLLEVDFGASVAEQGLVELPRRIGDDFPRDGL